MNSQKNKYIYLINDLIEQKINEILLAIKIKMIREDTYDQIINKIYLFIYRQIKNFLINNIDNFDEDLLIKRINILIKTYLKQIIK